MIRGDILNRFDKQCESLYLSDRERKVHYTIEFTTHTSDPGKEIKSTDFPFDNVELLMAISEALQKRGYIPKSANDAELMATKYHLEDMRKLIFKDVQK